MKKTLIMYSGGPDSVYEAAYRLKETDEIIHLHHIHFINHEGRAESERIVNREILPLLMEIRPFTYSESIIDHRQHKRIPFDMCVVAFEAGVCARGMIDDKEEPYFTHWTIGTCSEEGHNYERFAFYDPIPTAVCWPYKAPVFELGSIITKEEEKQYLKELGIDMTISCRNPINNKECGVCNKCQYYKK